MAPLSVIIHERLDAWARQLRPRLREVPVAWAETRSGDDLARALARAVVPIIVIDLGDQPTRRLDAVALARQTAPDALILVLDPVGRAGVAEVARELGATHVLSGLANPPEVARLLGRWLLLARRRTLANGWAFSADPSDPWDPDSIAFLAPKPGRPVPAR